MKKFFYLFSVLFLSTTSTAFAEEDPQIVFLKSLVNISSGTSEVDGIKKVQDLVKDRLKELGFHIEEVQSEEAGIEAKQLVGTLSGSSKNFITFVTHADTVFDKSNHFELTSDQKRIKGPGVGDNKGGIVVGLDAIREFLKQNSKPNYSLRFVVSPTEETGSVGFRILLKKYAEDSKLILGMEPALEDGSIVKARKGVRWYQVEVVGSESHAGTSPESGVNACHQLSIFLNKIMQLNDFKNGNTISIGHIEGGKNKFNIVCGQAQAKIDFRFVNNQAKDQISRKIESILSKPSIKSFKSKAEPKIDFKIVTEVPPFAISKASQNLIEKYLKFVKEIEGRPIQAILTGGAADLNYMDKNILMIDGLGPVGGAYHTIDEYIEVGSLKARTEALSQFLLQFDKEPNH